jgi:hypothetical protein
MDTYLLDAAFLKKLDQQKERTIYASITALDNHDYPLETLDGRVTTGSINVDGKSAVRRSCTLSLIAFENDAMVTDKFWSYNNKF